MFLLWNNFDLEWFNFKRLVRCYKIYLRLDYYNFICIYLLFYILLSSVYKEFVWFLIDKFVRIYLKYNERETVDKCREKKN